MSARSGCSPLRWMTTLRITGRSCGYERASSSSRWSGSGVVEVDHQPHAAARDPYPDPDPVVFRVHEVHVVAAVVWALGLEEEVRAEDGSAGVAGPAAEVLGPPVAREAAGLQPVRGRAADEVVAQVL